MSAFLYKGHEVTLSYITDGALSPLWVAEVAGTDMLHIVPALAADDPERVRHLVRDWIDDGMPAGGPSA